MGNSVQDTQTAESMHILLFANTRHREKESAIAEQRMVIIYAREEKTNHE